MARSGKQSAKKAKGAASRAVAKADDATTQHTAAGNAMWKLLSVGTTLVATKLATDAAQKGWKLATGRNVPVKGDYEREKTRDVILFTAISSMAVAAARVAAERGAATYYRRSSGHLPKALEDDQVAPEDKKVAKKLAKAKHKAEKATQKAIDKATGNG
ncbi:DUF4235 domain-containing protein [Intrasporangium sp. YIM S08009]|uniref:DUF4235 domain-containing protein n=1 Tax=Intrasporangium zincisolvens TaxID=3080018 RepID=UPI002B06192D|nr:DUF4235 domain-containing protein [Intrasporangium sp. YIM S08009]